MFKWLLGLLGRRPLVPKVPEHLLWMHQGLPPKSLIGAPVDVHGQLGVCVGVEALTILVWWHDMGPVPKEIRDAMEKATREGDGKDCHT